MVTVELTASEAAHIAAVLAIYHDETLDTDCLGCYCKPKPEHELPCPVAAGMPPEGLIPPRALVEKIVAALTASMASPG